ncbi:MAG: FAD-dependent oxidoreductase [Dehalococcoidales bacterium]|nr:MAG: FAD-dependent oxidoreductase [Dehalococcoidales bacterium]
MTFDELRKQAIAEWEALQKSDKPRILVGMATCGRAAGAGALVNLIKEELSRRSIGAVVTEVGCIGMCYAEPLVDIIKPGRPRICYGNVTPETAAELIEDYLINDNPRPDLAMGTIGEETIEGIPKLTDLTIMKPQVRISLRNCGHIDPDDIRQYIANSGYNGLIRVLEMTPKEVVDEVSKSGLRGRGGAGAYTGFKWERLWEAPGNEKYLICNADEGDPGAFMDRSLLEGDPHSVLEGMLIGAYATRSNHGYIYCRAEYPLAIQRLETAIKQMKEYNLLGDNILGTDFSFDLTIKEGAGAFVCGEETALMMSIEGRRGMPRPRPPFPAQSGLWGKPSNVNNVETWANISAIFQRDADWYAQYGTESSKGTKTFALAGKIVNTGLVEVPLGITIGEIIYEVGGGIVDNKKFKAVLTGGPSGGCLPASQLDLPVDYESLTQAGTIMGSGGFVVADEDTCMVDMAKFFLSFTQDESCGKCTPCRVGTRHMLDILERISRGKGQLDDIERLERLANTIKATSLCQLGGSAPNPVLTTLRYFREEYEEHIEKKRCEAGVCRTLVRAPCQNACPAGIDVPRYIRAIIQGKPEVATAVIREKVPFPAVLGYICVHFCEAKCRRGQLDDAIAIRLLKRYAAERDDGDWKQRIKKLPPTEKKVAIAGSGPAGLTAAYYLAKQGHTVTVFEAESKPGGLLRYGIPEYRLPNSIVDKEISDILEVGVELKTNSPLQDLAATFEQGYSAIFLATGALSSRKMGIPGEDIGGVMHALDFLKRVNAGEKVELGKKVAVIGGGNAAVDAARTALRLGTEQVNIIYRRSREELPALSEEIEEAEHEGIKLDVLAAPTEVLSDNGRLTGLKCIRMELGSPDAGGRRRPVPQEGSEFDVAVDNVIIAVGQEVPKSTLPEELEFTGFGTLQVDPETLQTNVDGVFAGGDVVSGPADVIAAIAAGRLVASSIDQYLGGDGDIDEVLASPEGEVEPFNVEEAEGEKYRIAMKLLSLDKRGNCFDMVELGYENGEAVEEADRCLRCDLEETD